MTDTDFLNSYAVPFHSVLAVFYGAIQIVTTTTTTRTYERWSGYINLWILTWILVIYNEVMNEPVGSTRPLTEWVKYQPSLSDWIRICLHIRTVLWPREPHVGKLHLCRPKSQYVFNCLSPLRYIQSCSILYNIFSVPLIYNDRIHCGAWYITGRWPILITSIETGFGGFFLCNEQDLYNETDVVEVLYFTYRDISSESFIGHK